VHDGEWVSVSVSGVAKPTQYDALAIYLEDEADTSIGLNRLIKYQWADADLAYLQQGSKSFRCRCRNRES
jgi:hypothetical protein